MVVLGLCGVDAACDAVADVQGALALHDGGATFAAGTPAASGARLKLVARAAPTCASPSLHLEADAWLEVTYRYAADPARTHTVKVSLSTRSGLTLASFPHTLVLGAAGTTYAEETLETVVSPRVE